jgi:hypothetical protein
MNAVKELALAVLAAALFGGPIFFYFLFYNSYFMMS